MMPSSTSLFLASMIPFLPKNFKCWACSPASAALFVSRIFSRPSISALLALMLSKTAPSALASDFKRALRRAAWTGGVGTVLLGSVSFSYSMSAIAAAVLEDAIAFEMEICRGTSGCISSGADGPEAEKRELPSKGFLVVERDLSSSGVEEPLATAALIFYRGS